MDPVALHSDDPRLLGRRSAGGPKETEKPRPEEPLLRPGRAKVVQEVKVRAAKSKEAEIVGLLREGMFVTIHEVCTKSAHVEYSVTGLTGWVTLSKNSEPVLKEDPWARPFVKKAPRASEAPLEPCEKVFTKPAALGPVTKATGGCAGDHRSLPPSAWERIHQKFQQTATSFTTPSSKVQRGEAIAGIADWSGDHRSLPASAWERIHQKFQQTATSFTSPSSKGQRGEAIGGRADWSGDHRSLPASAWERIHEAFDSPRRPESAAASGWWMAFWQQATRDLCCSR
ncbi:unnamed protein product [Symbiodinium sp. CCMP2592]|nr:unnamed protein product [Symbiodinium sp. CCMP2592]